MKFEKLCLLTFFVLAGLVHSTAGLADEKGQALAQAAYDRPDGKTLVMKTSMVMEREGSQPRQREFYSYRKDFSDGSIKSLVRFILPADVQDTGLLTDNHPDGENEQRIYLPALARVRRIAGDRKGGRFVGSDVYYEDLEDRKVSEDVHTYIGEQALDGVLCEIIESVPIDPSNSSYSKRVVWIHPETLIAVRVDFYRDNENDPMKRFLVKKIDRIQGYWTPVLVEFSDLKGDHKTYMRLDKVSYDTDLPDSLFSQSILQSPSDEIPYRP